MFHRGWRITDEKDADRRALEDFVVGNAELEKLEAMLDRFNIFEAVGMERQEIRHSRFLSFLLDPNQPHGLGDAFLRRFLQSAVSGSDSAVVTPIELSLWNLDGTSVRQEWNRIDIFLLDDENRLAVIVENKIGSKEHSNQLERYYDLVREQYPQYRIVAVYLTPNGDDPSHPEYLPLDYGTVCEMLDEVRQSKASVMEPDAAVLATHYTDMMRRNIVGDSEVARLAQQIYQKHQRAIDLIYENRFAQQEAIRNVVTDIISENSKLFQNSKLTLHPKEWITFWLRDWDANSLMVADRKKWTGTNRVLLLVFCNYQEYLSVIMQIGPGDEETRLKLLSMAHNYPAIFNDAPEQLDPFVNTVFVKALLSPESYRTSTDAELEAEIRRNWNDFLESDLPRIDAALRAEEWIWEDAPESAPE